MSRSGYDYDCDDQWGLIRWRGAVASSIRSKNGQAFLRELLAALEAMPEKKLIGHSFSKEGAYCTLGVIGAMRGVEMPRIDYDDDNDPWAIRAQVKQALHIPGALAAEIMFENDEGDWRDNETPEQRWQRMHKWVTGQIKDSQP